MLKLGRGNKVDALQVPKLIQVVPRPALRMDQIQLGAHKNNRTNRRNRNSKRRMIRFGTGASVHEYRLRVIGI
jgi:hypothetical protein